MPGHGLIRAYGSEPLAAVAPFRFGDSAFGQRRGAALGTLTSRGVRRRQVDGEVVLGTDVAHGRRPDERLHQAIHHLGEPSVQPGLVHLRGIEDQQRAVLRLAVQHLLAEPRRPEARRVVDTGFEIVAGETA